MVLHRPVETARVSGNLRKPGQEFANGIPYGEGKQLWRKRDGFSLLWTWKRLWESWAMASHPSAEWNGSAIGNKIV